MAGSSCSVASHPSAVGPRSDDGLPRVDGLSSILSSGSLAASVMTSEQAALNKIKAMSSSSYVNKQTNYNCCNS